MQAKRLMRVEDLPFLDDDIPVSITSSQQDNEPADFDEVSEALDYLDPDMPYEEWIRIGMSLQHAFGDSGFSLWESWSRRGSKYPKKGEPSCMSHWLSFGRTSSNAVTIKTLFMKAGQAGFRSQRKKKNETANLPATASTAICTSIADVNIIDDCDDFLNEEEEDERVQLDSILKDFKRADCFSPLGIVGEVYKEIEAQAIISQPSYSLGATIALMGFLNRNRVKHGDLRTSFYVLSVGKTGSGKDNAVRFISKTLLKLGYNNNLEESLESSQGLIRKLSTSNNSVFLCEDEVKYSFDVTKSRNVNGCLLKAVQLILKLHNLPPYARNGTTKEGQSYESINPFLSIYHTSATPIVQSISRDDYESGMMRRYLLFLGSENPLEKADVFSRGEKQYDLLLNNLSRDFPPEKTFRDLRQVRFADSAYDLLKEFKANIIRNMHILEGHPIQSVFGSAFKEVLKLSMICASPMDAFISQESAEWAISAVIHSLENHFVFSDSLVENHQEKKVARIEELIKSLTKGNRQWIKYSVILKKSRWLRSKDLKEILEHLQETNCIEVKNIGTGGRPSEHIRYIKPSERKA